MKKSAVFSLAYWVLFVFPFIGYGISIVQYAVNIPYQDDYDAVLGFINSIVQKHTLKENLILLFSQHNEHRIVFDRLIALIYYSLFHEVNFKAFILIGNLGWVLFVIIFLCYCRRTHNLPPTYLLPIPYILLSFSHWQNMFFAMASLQNYWFVFFAVAFLICLSQDRYFLSCILFPFAFFTSGGGIVLYPLANIYLLLRKKQPAFIYFFTSSTICLWFYFLNYHRPYPISVAEIVSDPIRLVVFFFVFMGNILPVNNIPGPHAGMGILFLSLFIGIILFFSILYLAARQANKEEDGYFFLLTACFIMLIASTTAATRSEGNVATAIASRYSLFPLLSLACCYVLMAISISKSSKYRKVILISAILSAILFWGSGVFHMEQTDYFRSIQQERIISLMEFNESKGASLLYPNTDRAMQILLMSKELNVYNYQDQIHNMTMPP
jgi:hypothetical protein